jgi:hypothetical protein
MGKVKYITAICNALNSLNTALIAFLYKRERHLKK